MMTLSPLAIPPVVSLIARLLVTKTLLMGTFITLMLTACTPAQDPAHTARTGSPHEGDDKPRIYASTNVWGAVAQAVGGDNVTVIVGVNTPTQDPHDYQSTAQDRLNISKAKLVLVNGGGYDDWAISLSEAVSPQPVIINAVSVSGFNVPAQPMQETHDHADEKGQATAGHEHHHHAEFNEHVFYSLDTASKVAQAVATQLSQADPSHQAQYRQNLQAFNQQIGELKTQAKATPAGKTAFVTEPVAHYLMADMGIKTITPDAFIEQAETEVGVSAKVLKDSKAMITNQQAAVLVLNAQTEDATSSLLLADAKAVNMPVVKVYETLPAPLTVASKGDAYRDFMKKAIQDLQQALGK